MAFELGGGEAVLGEAGLGVLDGAGAVGAGEPVGVSYGE